MILIHPSSLGRLMTEPKSIDPAQITDEIEAIIEKKVRSDDEKAILQAALDRSLSAGAKTYCIELAKEFIYGYRAPPSTKVLEKGMICEDQSIALYNEVFFTNLSKNPQRRENEWLTGECDIDTGKKIIDVKSSWSLATFPAIKADAHDIGYEWQGRAYMMLWDRPVFELAFCMVSTPLELIGWEDESAHIVDHIDPALRVTSVLYARDTSKEELIKTKVDAARDFINQIFDQVAADHSGVVIKRAVAA